MQRRAFDLIASVGGLVLVVVLIVAGGLGLWAHAFTNSSVRNQLAKQEITFPPKSAFAHAKAGGEVTPSMIPSVSQYAGQQLLTGQQAKVYANDFIAVHLSEMPYGGVYSKVSNASRAAKPGSAEATKLAALQTTTFQGTTLRGLLLEAYAFSVFGTIALWAAIAAFVLAILMAVFAAFGFYHFGRTPPEAELLAPQQQT